MKKQWIVHPEFNCTVCTNFRKDPSDTSYNLWDVIADGLAPADAKLIAAAPEMLEALKEAKNNIEQLCKTINLLKPNKVHVEDFIEVIVKAISNAKRS